MTNKSVVYLQKMTLFPTDRTAQTKRVDESARTSGRLEPTERTEKLSVARSNDQASQVQGLSPSPSFGTLPKLK